MKQPRGRVVEGLGRVPGLAWRLGRLGLRAGLGVVSGQGRVLERRAELGWAGQTQLR